MIVYHMRIIPPAHLDRGETRQSSRKETRHQDDVRMPLILYNTSSKSLSKGDKNGYSEKISKDCLGGKICFRSPGIFPETGKQ